MKRGKISSLGPERACKTQITDIYTFLTRKGRFIKGMTIETTVNLLKIGRFVSLIFVEYNN